MLAPVILFFVNCFRSLQNGWRRLLRRRVDYVKITLQGDLPEFTPTISWWRRRLFGGREPLSMSALRRQLQQVGDDPETQGVLLVINGFGAGWATLQSLREELLAFRATGKRVVAYLYTPDNVGYYTACAADEIVLPPAATFNVLGFHSEVQYLRDALAKVGIQAEVEAVSPYKSAYERFTRADMSPENREQLERILDHRYCELVQVIAQSRAKSTALVEALIDRAPLSGEDAQQIGLVDNLLYEDELATHLQHGEREAVMKEWDAARKALHLPMAKRHRNIIGVIPVEGTIIAGSSQRLPIPLPLFGQEQAGSDSFAQAIRQAERNKRIAAVVLYVDSPGGDAFASDLMWREVLRLKQSKPVVVVMGDVAASGGYYLAAPASAIIAQPATLTGSIGVISLRPVLAELLAKADIHTTTISRGAHSGMFASTQPLTESERLAWRRLIGTTYQAFKDRVSSGRGISQAQLEPIAGGRVWTGSDALERGLVDELGGMRAGVRTAQALAKLPTDERAPLLVLRGAGTHLPPQPFPASSLAALLATVEQGLKPRVWALMPWVGL